MKFPKTRSGTDAAYQSYAIHDKVRFAILDRQGRARRTWSGVAEQYHHLATTTVAPLDFTVEIGPFEPEGGSRWLNKNTFFASDDYFYCRSDSYKWANWSFEVTRSSTATPIRVRVDSNFAGARFISGVIINFLIHWSLMEKGAPLIHASGIVAPTGEGKAIAARGGGGKTSTALRLCVERDFRLLGDNFVVIADGEMLRFASPLSIFTYNATTKVEATLSRSERVLFAAKSHLHKLSRGNVKIFTKVEPERILDGKTARQAPMQSLLILRVGNQAAVQPADRAQAIRHLVANQRIEFNHFEHYLAAATAIRSKHMWTEHWGRYEGALATALPEFTSYYICDVEIGKPAKHIEHLLIDSSSKPR